MCQTLFQKTSVSFSNSFNQMVGISCFNMILTLNTESSKTSPHPIRKLMLFILSHAKPSRSCCWHIWGKGILRVFLKKLSCYLPLNSGRKVPIFLLAEHHSTFPATWNYSPGYLNPGFTLFKVNLPSFDQISSMCKMFFYCQV